MGPALELTSVPAWTTAVTRPDADLSGRQWSIIAFGPAGAEVAGGWSDQIAASGPVSAVRVHEIAEQDGDGPARAALLADLADARVGWRLMIAGPAHACLKVRALAMEMGIADDEMTVASTDVASRSVQCVHCRTVTSAVVELEDVLACSGCGRNLLVYYHVSRRQGAHLGFMVDAEEQTAR